MDETHGKTNVYDGEENIVTTKLGSSCLFPTDT
jgi:hypothetical protein